MEWLRNGLWAKIFAQRKIKPGLTELPVLRNQAYGAEIPRFEFFELGVTLLEDGILAVSAAVKSFLAGRRFGRGCTTEIY